MSIFQLFGALRSSASVPVYSPVTNQVRGYNKYRYHLLDIEPGTIYGSTIRLSGKQTLFSAYIALRKKLKEDNFFERVEKSMYHETPTQHRRRSRQNAKDRTFREYRTFRLRAATDYVKRSQEKEKDTRKYL